MVDQIRVFSLVKGFHGGVARYTSMLSKLNERPNLEFKTAVINSSRWTCNRDDLDSHDMQEITIRGRLDPGWIEPCGQIIDRFCPDLLFVHGDCVAGGVARLLQQRAKHSLPYVSSNHGYYQATSLSRVPIQPIRNWLTPRTYQHRALAVVTVADYCKQYLIRRGVDPDRITVVHNGIEPTPPKCPPVQRSTLGLTEEDIIIGSVTRIDPAKGVEYLVDAAARIRGRSRNVHLVLVGDGQSTTRLKRLCQRLGISSHVHFIGYQDNVQAWLDLFDVVALPTLAESHSISLLEAMRSRKPIVTTSVGGNTESVRDDMEALVVPPKSAADLAIALERLIDDSVLARRLSEAAEERFHKHFTITHMLGKTEEWLRDCVRMARSQ
jgi:glycosyltransferase involved in cell wall biosynthesis